VGVHATGAGGAAPLAGRRPGALRGWRRWSCSSSCLGVYQPLRIGDGLLGQVVASPARVSGSGVVSRQPCGFSERLEASRATATEAAETRRPTLAWSPLLPTHERLDTRTASTLTASSKLIELAAWVEPIGSGEFSCRCGWTGVHR